ncbi:hypothetical protein GCM10022205_36240 [Spinactinospora alkalitolerans]
MVKTCVHHDGNRHDAQFPHRLRTAVPYSLIPPPPPPSARPNTFPADPAVPTTKSSVSRSRGHRLMARPVLGLKGLEAQPKEGSAVTGRSSRVAEGPLQGSPTRTPSLLGPAFTTPWGRG